ncbi:retinoblastoma-like protein 2 isoform X1 [Eptesicus fuscus]|uniref:retinoblastoma-like protein 2 isoform X1 n=1 Tax=Eptesicus fuscus TaxID=29078 RepID=UPI0024048BA9|nr:retinoblastoma-like protein 2 isoform X1 [Eptesicus fuscus]XP_054566142.1 retinoblastoma-like protein 2 isoform X1 [Eptesicus fuscus]
MPSGGDQSPPPPPPAPAAAGSEEEEEEEEDDDGEAEDSALPTRTPTPQTQQRFDELCCRLNMDEAARAEAWDSYRSMSESYTLEGNDLHWLACALYVACRKSVPTVSKGTAEGNYVSLTRLLRCSEQSLIEFFNKMKKWEEMANLPQDFRERTERLERNFTVSAVIFKKYEPIFQDIFKYPQEEQPRQQRGRKQRRQPCTVSEIFHFCWVLFIYAKGNFPMISDDLVNSYHLLLCALDLVYGNALQCSNRKELVNPNFKGLSEDFHAKDFKPSSDPPCVIEKLCSLHDGLVLEAKGIKEHFWKPYIRKLYEKKLLKGKEENLTGFLEPGNFGENLKAISKAYEEYVLTVGNLDERVFLGEDAEEEIGTLSRALSAWAGAEPAERVQAKNILQQHLDKSKALRISTPLTGVRYIKDNSSPCVTPVSAATHSLSRLHTMLAGLRNVPSERLGQILRTCSRDPTQAIANRLKEMYEIYSQHSQPDEDFSNCAKEIASRHFRFAEMLYYKVLESIIEQEQKRLGDMDLSGILEQDAFHRSLLACCLEVVTFSYKPPGNFPFITEIFEVPLYHFYKVIEVFIRAEDGLCREVVKHLNQIEEQILDHLAWKPESPLWDRIRENDNRVPACEEVMPPQNLERADEICMAGSPLTPRRVSEVRADTGGLGRSITSPTTLYDRYSSPAASSTRRRLFVENDSPSDRGAPGRAPPQPLVSAVPVQNVTGEAVPVTPVPGQTLVPMATATVTANNGQTVTIPVQGIANENGGITFFPVQVNVGGQAQAMTGSMQPLSAQALAGNLSSQQVPGTTLQVPGQVALQQLSPGGQKQGAPLPSGGSRPRKTSSLSLFFRKVYHLAGVRLRDLCAKLDISDELRKKIWTCFEFSIIQCPELMMDRHLDQLLMCAIYVMAKVTKEDKSFQNIMRCYRTQPQARSQVYRSVLIKGRRKRRNSGSSESRSHQNSPTELNKDRTSRDSSPVMRSSSTLPVPQPSSAPPTPTRLTGAHSDLEEEERGDLIQFYNNVYVKQIKTFALKYSQANMTDAPPLSPYPFVRAGSPRRVQLSQNHPVYISPHKHEIVLSPREKIFYYFSNSPSKRLREINSMIRTGETPTKKRGILLEDGSESPAKRICPENHTALLRRLQDVANDRGSH